MQRLAPRPRQLYSASALCRTCLEKQYRAGNAKCFAFTAKRVSLSPSSARAEQSFSQIRGVSTASSPATSPSNTPRPRFYALFPETLPDGPPPDGPFPIDVRALRREFLRLQATAHPDFHHAAAGSSDKQAASRARAEAVSSLINEAYKTLAAPLPRAQYLLRELHGVDLAGDEAGGAAEADPELLMLVMEVREAIEEAEAEEELAGLREENEGRIRDAEGALARAFAAGDVAAAKNEAVRLRYWVNIKESLDNWESGQPVRLQH